MEDDLIIGKEAEEPAPIAESEAAMDVDIYVPTEVELIVAACDAMNTVESMDPLTERGRKRKKRIIRKSMEILEFAIDNLHALCFDEKPNDNEDNQES